MRVASMEEGNSSVDVSSQTSNTSIVIANCRNVTVSQNSESDLEPTMKTFRANGDFKQTTTYSEETGGNVRGEVYFVGKLYTYIKDGAEKFEFPVVLINHTDCYRLRVFDKNLHGSFERYKGRMVRLESLRRKDGCLLINRKTKITELQLGETVLPAHDVKKKAEQIAEECEPSKMTAIASIGELKHVRINTQGKISKLFPVESRRLKTGECISFRKLRVSDNSESIDLVLWRDQAHQQLNEGAEIEIKKAFVKEYEDGTKFLSGQTYTIVESPTKDADSRDLQEFGSARRSLFDTGTIEAVGEVMRYSSCKRCNTKLDDDVKCTKCKFRYNMKTAGCGIRCTLLVKLTNKPKEYILFRPDVDTLLQSFYPNEENIDDTIMSDDLEDKILACLPVSVSFTTNGENVMNLIDVNAE